MKIKQVKNKKGGIEISSLAKWIILVVFLIIILIILIAVRTGGEDTIGSICEKTGGFIGCR